jgi:hypothetical protein
MKTGNPTGLSKKLNAEQDMIQQESLNAFKMRKRHLDLFTYPVGAATLLCQSPLAGHIARAFID